MKISLGEALRVVGMNRNLYNSRRRSGYLGFMGAADQAGPRARYDIGHVLALKAYDTFLGRGVSADDVEEIILRRMAQIREAAVNYYFKREIEGLDNPDLLVFIEGPEFKEVLGGSWSQVSPYIDDQFKSINRHRTDAGIVSHMWRQMPSRIVMLNLLTVWCELAVDPVFREVNASSSDGSHQKSNKF